MFHFHADLFAINSRPTYTILYILCELKVILVRILRQLIFEGPGGDEMK